ncbi:hypothetical protein D9623_00005 [Azospirillum brasilense]|nr:hypothetical protein D9623_00005 [Azospirillum brasilense]
MARRAGEGGARGGKFGKSATRGGGGGGVRVAGSSAKAQPPHPNPLPRGEREHQALQSRSPNRWTAPRSARFRTTTALRPISTASAASAMIDTTRTIRAMSRAQARRLRRRAARCAASFCRRALPRRP